MGRFKSKNCIICGQINVAAGIGAVTTDGLIICGLCYTSAEFDENTNITKNTSQEIIDYYIAHDIFFTPGTEAVTYLSLGIKQTVAQFDLERKLWRMIPYGKRSYRQEAWLFHDSDVLSFELIKYGKYSSICDSMKIKIIIDDAHGTAVYITFIDYPYEVKRDSGKYRKILEQAEICLTAFENMKKTK